MPAGLHSKEQDWPALADRDSCSGWDGLDSLAEAVLRNRHCEPREMVAKVMEAVKLWSHAPELPDDMTVMIARGINVGQA